MKHLPLLALALLFSFSASSFATSYKVLGDHKELDFLVEPVDENSVGVTKEDLELLENHFEGFDNTSYQRDYPI